jgi:hypothetical protein
LKAKAMAKAKEQWCLSSYDFKILLSLTLMNWPYIFIDSMA